MAEARNEQLIKNVKRKQLSVNSYNKSAFWPMIQTTPIAITTPALVLGIILFLYEDSAFNSKSKLTGTTLILMSIAHLLAKLSIASANAAQYTKAEYESVKRVIGDIAGASIKAIAASETAITRTGKAIENVANTLNKLGTITGDVMVRLTDIHAGTMVVLQGNAKEVSAAIRDGITKGLFKPELKADVQVDINADTEINIDEINTGVNWRFC